MNELANKAAEIALRLAALSPGRRPDTVDLDALEQIAVDVLQQVSAARLGASSYAIGEIRGCWPAYAPGRQERHAPGAALNARLSGIGSKRA